MELQEAMGQLQETGTAQNRKIYGRHGVNGEMFGVSYANLNKMAKAARRDHSLALQLWATGNHDARVLATMVADPAQADESLLDSWLADLDSYVLADAFSGYVGKTSLAQAKGEEWIGSPEEWPGRAGWRMIAHLAMKESGLSDAYFAAHLATIEGDIHGSKNRVKDAMNSALIAIGIRNTVLAEQALAAAARIGQVEVDHGETNCKTPDAAHYIRRTLERQRRKATTAAEKANSKPAQSL